MVNMADVRIQEAAKLGFTTCILPYGNLRALSGKTPEGIRLEGVKNLKDAADLVV